MLAELPPEELPPEAGEGPEIVGVLKRSVYGTRAFNSQLGKGDQGCFREPWFQPGTESDRVILVSAATRVEG